MRLLIRSDLNNIFEIERGGKKYTRDNLPGYFQPYRRFYSWVFNEHFSMVSYYSYDLSLQAKGLFITGIQVAQSIPRYTGQLFLLLIKR